MSVYYIDYHTWIVSNIPTLSSISFLYEVDKDGKVFLDFEYFVKKILIARLKESIIVVDQPCIMTLIQRTLLDDFTEICFNIKEYDQGEIQFIIYKVIKDFSAKLSVSGSRNIKSAFNSLCKILQGRGKNFQWSFTDEVYESLKSRDETEKQLFFDKASRIIINRWSSPSVELERFIQSHPNIVKISFARYWHPYCLNSSESHDWSIKLPDIFSSCNNVTHLRQNGCVPMSMVTNAIDNQSLRNLEALDVTFEDENSLVLFLKSAHLMKKLRYLCVTRCYMHVKMPKDEAINMMKRSMSIQKLEFPTFELRDSEFRQQVDFFLCRNNSLSWPNVHKLLIDMCIGLLSCDTLLWMPPYILLEIFDWLPYEEDVISIMHLVPQYKKVFLIEGVVNSMKKLIEQRARNIRKTVK